MKQDEIMELAWQSGLIEPEQILLSFDATVFQLEAFAKLCFEKGRQQGIEQERALWKLAQIHKEMGGL
jgi:hypothetical protein